MVVVMDLIRALLVAESFVTLPQRFCHTLSADRGLAAAYSMFILYTIQDAADAARKGWTTYARGDHAKH